MSGVVTNQIKTVSHLDSDVQTLNDVSKMLMEQMKKVQGSPAEIEQAQCMCEIAKQVIDVSKTKIAAASLVIKAMNG